MTKHNHHEHCEHEEVAYCGHCQVVYCKGCKREWSDCKLNHYPLTWYPYTTQIYGTGTATDIPNVTTWAGTQDIHNIVQDAHCAHA